MLLMVASLSKIGFVAAPIILEMSSSIDRKLKKRVVVVVVWVVLMN